jgi:hypothetical protein
MALHPEIPVIAIVAQETGTQRRRRREQMARPADRDAPTGSDSPCLAPWVKAWSMTAAPQLHPTKMNSRLRRSAVPGRPRGYGA